jgi:hypothetical protein
VVDHWLPQNTTNTRVEVSTCPPPYFKLLVFEPPEGRPAELLSPLVKGRTTPATGGWPPPGWSGGPGIPPGAATAVPTSANAASAIAAEAASNIRTNPRIIVPASQA